jgi:surfeit locus 1 family protein
MIGPRRFPVGLTLATLIALAILCGLGVWQVQRLHWKQDLLARIAALKAAPAQPGVGALDPRAPGGEQNITPVAAARPGLGDAPFLELHAIRDGQAGSRLISACAVSGLRFRTLLIDRGFVGDTISARPPADGADRTPLRVVGVLRAPDPPNAFTPPNDVRANHWYARDSPPIAKPLGAPAPAPLMLLAETSTNPGWKALIPEPLPAEIPNRHLEYAITWFGLAGALMAVYAAMLWRMWKS